MFLHACKQTFAYLKCANLKKWKVLQCAICRVLLYLKTNLLQDFHICTSVPLTCFQLVNKLSFIFKWFYFHITSQLWKYWTKPRTHKVLGNLFLSLKSEHRLWPVSVNLSMLTSHPYDMYYLFIRNDSRFFDWDQWQQNRYWRLDFRIDFPGNQKWSCIYVL